MNPRRALIADDNLAMAGYVRSLLSKIGFDTLDTALDGAEALKMIGARSYDLIVLDHNMPSICGLDIIRAVRRTMPQCKAALMLMTGRVDRKMIDAIRTENLGVDAVFAKPFDAETFARKVEARCGFHASARAPLSAISADPGPSRSRRPIASISAGRDGDLFAIRFAGTVTHNDKATMKNAFDQALSDDGRRLAVDVSEVISFDEFFLGFLLVFCGTAAEKTKQVALVTGPRSPASRLFTLGVDRIVPSVCALADLRPPPAALHA